jgi:hypothetical protein
MEKYRDPGSISERFLEAGGQYSQRMDNHGAYQGLAAFFSARLGEGSEFSAVLSFAI